jgi:hypothetical protein
VPLGAPPSGLRNPGEQGGLANAPNPRHRPSVDLLELSGKDMRHGPLEARKRELAKLLGRGSWALHFNEHIDEPGDIVFRHACKLGFKGIVSKRLGSPYRSGRSPDWLKMKNSDAPAVKREAEEDWGKRNDDDGQGEDLAVRGNLARH